VEALSAIRKHDPDVVLLDISLGQGPTGLDLAFLLHRQRPDIAILFLTKHPDQRTAGISMGDIPPNAGFLRKDLVRDTEYLLRSIDAVLGDRPLEVRQNEDPGKPLAGLGAKHLDVLRLVAMGYTNDHIARVKQVNDSTVERWMAEVFKALGIPSAGSVNPRVEAVRQFIAAAGVPERP
jgi:DNA-binding NarL/FixJ family response regulator